jgi:hypothetical protein
VPDPIVIVGRGTSGRACADALAGRAPAAVVDRAPGSGADLQATALRWDGRTLRAIGPSGPVEIAATALVVATGTRPLSPVELGLAGARPAGVLPAPAACELIAHGLFRPARPVVVGGGRWAASAAAVLAEAGADVTVVAPDGILVPVEAVALHERLTPVRIGGDRNVERLECDGATFECDAVVLAHGLVPVRNVDGAVENGERVAYAQPTVDPPSDAISRAAGEEAARAALALTGTTATIGPWSSSPSSPPSA